jgi:SAM-dependent methyltransferase
VTSQREIWDNRYRERAPAAARLQPPSEFAQQVGWRLTAPLRVLELGCGPGWDAAFFAGQGHAVLATDFSDSLIAADKERFSGVAGLTFRAADTQEALANEHELPDASFDVVYARLSLHYFDDAETRSIFKHMARVLRSGGLLAFMCKSTEDPLYGKGVELEPDVFEFRHRRHFFSEAYTRDVLAGRFDVSLTKRSGALYGEPSAWIEVLARKR